MTCLLLARALFDNVAESALELSFRKGDVLQVLDQNPGASLQGWYLCKANGKQGLAAANRLRILKMENATADYDVPKPILAEKRRPSKELSGFSPGTYDVVRPLGSIPDSPPSERSSRLSSYLGNYFGNTSFYSPSVTSSSGSSSGGGSRLSCVTSCDFALSERNSASASTEPSSSSSGEVYDVLRSQARRVSTITSPEPFNPTRFSPNAEDYDWIDSDIRTSPEEQQQSQNEDQYDRLPARPTLLPKTAAKPPKKKAEKRNSFQRLYDLLPSQRRPVSRVMSEPLVESDSKKKEDFAEKVAVARENAQYISKQAAVVRISCMQSQVQTELLRLFSFVSSEKWRETARLQAKLTEVKLCCEYLVTHLGTLVRFVVQAARMSTEKRDNETTPKTDLDVKLRSLIDAVYLSCEKIKKHLQVMNEENWTANMRTITTIESVVTTGQILTEDVRKMTAFVLGNAQLIFAAHDDQKLQNRPLPTAPYRSNLGQTETAEADDGNHEYEDVDYGNVSAPVVPRSPTLEKRILNSYIVEVNEQVGVLRPMVQSFIDQMFADHSVTSVRTIQGAENIAQRTTKLIRLTDSIFANLTLSETEELRNKIKKTGGYISTAHKRFNLELRTATKNPDEIRFRNVKLSLDYLNELCQFLKNATETEV